MLEKHAFFSILAISLFLFSATLYAQVSVSPNPVEITQSNNSKLTIIGVGTAANPYTETIDGYTLLRNKKGIYVYAKLNKNLKLIPSKLKAHNPKHRTKKELKCLGNQIPKHLK